jgi:hypothetical protein
METLGYLQVAEFYPTVQSQAPHAPVLRRVKSRQTKVSNGIGDRTSLHPIWDNALTCTMF